MQTIALEEHFWTAELAAPPGTGPLARPDGARLDAQLRDLGVDRIASMDAAGIDVQVLSHVQPAAQGLAGDLGVMAARNANDALAAAIARHPDRLAGFATLPTSDPQKAAAELERAARSLGLVGAMLHSTLGTNGAFLDDERFEPLLAAFEDLDVPLYLHPSSAPKSVADVLFAGLTPAIAGRLATNAWGWHAEAGLHALRLVASGTFERHPGLKLIVGHCGEMLPFMFARIDEMLPPKVTGLPHPPSTYVHRNMWVTTSGMFSLPPVLCSIAVMGVDRVLFSVDYPFATNMAGRHLLDALSLSPADKAKVSPAKTPPASCASHERLCPAYLGTLFGGVKGSGLQAAGAGLAAPGLTSSDISAQKLYEPAEHGCPALEVAVALVDGQIVVEQLDDSVGTVGCEHHLHGRRAGWQRVLACDAPGEDHSPRRVDLDVRTAHGRVAEVEGERPARLGVQIGPIRRSTGSAEPDRRSRGRRRRAARRFAPSRSAPLGWSRSAAGAFGAVIFVF